MARACWRLLAVVASCIATGLHAQTALSPAAEPILLEAGKTIQGQLAGGQSHKYQFLLQPGQYARVSVEQPNINVALACVGPDGQELFAADNYAIGDTETAEVIGQLPGSYRIRVTTPDTKAPLGRYQITLSDIEVATERHRMRVAAALAFSEAMNSYRQGTREAMLRAIGNLEHSLARWRAAQDPAQEATTLLFIALTDIQLGEQQKALDSATRALAASQAAHDRKAEGRAFDSIGEVYNYFGDKSRAIEYYNQALPLMRAVHDRAGEGNTLNNLGVAYARTGEKRKALEHYDAAMQVFRELQDRHMLAEVAGNIGVTYDNLGEYPRALENHQQDLALLEAWTEVLRPALSDRLGRALFIGTPKGRNHFYELFQAAREHADWAAFHYTTEQGGIVSLAELEASRADLDERTYRQEYQASFESLGVGAVYHAFDRAHNVGRVRYDPQFPLLWALDFNINPFCSVLAQTDGRRVHIFDEMVLPNSNTLAACEEFLNRTKDLPGMPLNVYVYGDATGEQHKTSASHTDWQIVKNFFGRYTDRYQASFQVPRSNPPVKDRINCVNAILRNHAGQYRLAIDPTCKELIADFETVCWKADPHGNSLAELDKSDPRRTHVSDAVGYLIAHMFPMRMRAGERAGPILC